MADLVLLLLAIEQAQKAKADGHHLTWFAGMLIKVVGLANRAGWLWWGP
jgi:hypothetical protein